MTIPVNIESPVDSRLDNCIPAGAVEKVDAAIINW